MRFGPAGVHDLGPGMNREVGEHRTLGGFYPVLHWETVVLERSIRDLPETP